MVKIVFLDLDDTILDFQKGERIAIYKAFTKMGLPNDDETIKRYIEINLDCWRALERGEMTKDQVLVGRFELLFRELGIDASATLAQDIYEDLLSREHDFLPGAKELLCELADSGKYRLYIATNGIPAVQWPRIKDSDIEKYFDSIFISYDFGVGKPKKEFFDRCFEKIENFNRDECIIVGDSLTSDIKGGINAGILTCHYDRRNTIYGEIIPDYRITDLSELIPLLDSIK